jgi:hypothetical protein
MGLFNAGEEFHNLVKAHASTDKCEFCKGDLKRNAVYYDGATNSGHWTWMCRDCWEFNGVGLGTGMGQEYDSETNNKLRG